MRSPLFALFAGSLLAAPFAYADTITNFSFEGSSIFYGMANDFNTVSGTIAVNTTSGVVQSIQFNAAGLPFSGIQSQSGAEVFVGPAAAAFSFSVASLVGYTGSTFNLSGANDLFVGHVTAAESALPVEPVSLVASPTAVSSQVAVTPEPASLLLLSTGMLGLAGLLRRRRITA